MLGILSDSLERVTQHVDTVAGREIELELVRILQEFDRQVEHLRVGEREVIAQYGQLVLATGMLQGERWLQAALDVVGNLEGRFVLVHRDGAAKLAVGRDDNAGDDRLDVAPMVEKRGEASPRLFIHPVALSSR